MTLESRIIDQVRTLLARGCGSNQIARLMSGQISKSAVALISHEIKGDRPPPKSRTAITPDRILVAKCPGCHYTVALPCKICRARDYRHRHLMYKRERKRRRKLNRS